MCGNSTFTGKIEGGMISNLIETLKALGVIILYGKVTLVFENGKITRIIKEESLHL